jgi:hypothetical protein
VVSLTFSFCRWRNISPPPLAREIGAAEAEAMVVYYVNVY